VREEGKAQAPPSFPREEDEERRELEQYPVVQELEDFRQFVLDELLDEWETILRGEAFLFNVDHGYVMSQTGLATGLRDFLMTLRSRAEEQLPADSAILALVIRDVEVLRERINSLMTELQARADELADITPETPLQERLDRMVTRSGRLQETRVLPEDLEQPRELPPEDTEKVHRHLRLVEGFRSEDESSSAGGMAG
jgi:hypothetical protein